MNCSPLLFLLQVASTEAAGPAITPAGPSPEFILTDKSITGISGLTWIEGDRFLAVSDRAKAILPLRIAIHPESGAITAITPEPAIPVASAESDFEDITLNPATGTVNISSEQPPAITAWSLKGEPRQPVPLPKVFLSARSNLSMESLTFDSTAGRAWAANEDTLTIDGPVSSVEAGCLVRLQEFDASWKPVRQAAWRTETSRLRIGGSGTGVSGLCLLPGGELLVMERVMGSAGLEVRIFQAGLAAATDTTSLTTLSGSAVVPAGKELLFNKSCGFTNFEGIAAGPLLTDGSRSLILAADSGNGHRHAFMALRLTFPPSATPPAAADPHSAPASGKASGDSPKSPQ